MSVLNLGNIRINWRGDYDPDVLYVPDDAVSYEGSSYIAIKETKGDLPNGSKPVWNTLAQGVTQLTSAGDLLTHDGSASVRLPCGGQGQVLQVIDGQPAWHSPAIALSKRVWQLAKVNGLGGYHTRVYLMSDGTIKACGYGNSYSNGDPMGENLYLPSRVVFDDPNVRFVSVYSGGLQHYALTEDGQVWSWGKNDYGQLGHGDTVNRAIGKRIDFFVNNHIQIAKIIPGRNNYYEQGCAYFLTTDGKVYACGRNNYGNIGNGTTVDQSLPVRCGDLTDIVDVAVSSLPYSVYAVNGNGQLWVWGWNGSGQLGLGDSTDRYTPLSHPSIQDAISVAIACGYQQNGQGAKGTGIVVRADGSLWSTGCNERGQLGLGDKIDRQSFTKIDCPNTFKQVLMGDGRYPNCVAISNDNELYIWGANTYGAAGVGNTDWITSPIKPDAPFQGQVDKVCIGGGANFEGCIVRAGNVLWAAGYSEFGNLGINSVKGDNTTYQKVLGISGEIEDFDCFGKGWKPWGLGVLYRDGRVDTCGYDEGMGSLGTQVEKMHKQPILKNVIF